MRHISYSELIACLVGFTTAGVSIWMVTGVAGFLGAALALLMLAIAAIDFRFLIIPNELTAAAIALAVINAATTPSTTIIEGIADAAFRGSITMLFFLALRLTYGRLRQREGIGLGDVKLAFVAGAWLDWILIPVAIEIAALIGLAAYFVLKLVTKRPINSTSRLPFGLFFAPAIWLSWLLGELIFGPY